MTLQENDPHYIFPKWTNKTPLLVMLFFLSLILIAIYVFWFWLSPKNVNVGYQPDQPIPFSHRLHAGELGMDCRYCHTEVEREAHANVPTSETCMNCHDVVKTDSPHIQKLKESYDTNTPIEWVNVHVLPDYAYFDHSRHVNAGVSCVECHGRVDKMEVVRQVEPLSMSWCLECHRNPEGKLRPKEHVTNLGWEYDGDRKELGKELIQQYDLKPREDCSACHR